MNFRIKNFALGLLVTCAWLLLLPASTQAYPGQAAAESSTSAPASTDAGTTTAASQFTADSDDGAGHAGRRDVVSVGHDSVLPADAQARDVVSVFGSSTSHGEVTQDVVSVLGDTRITGKVGGDTVAVLGDDVIDGEVHGDVIAVLGNITLGPNARVHGELVDVLGTIARDPAAQVDGGIQSVLPGLMPGLSDTRSWFRHGLLLGRPLFIEPATGLIWGIAAVLLALYVVIALLFHDAVDHCAAVLQRHPGSSLLTAVLTCVLTPLLLMLLLITIVGVPVAILTLVCVALFGKTVTLSWLGRRCLALARPASAPPASSAPQTALSVLIGGILVTLAYLVPVLGMLVFLVLGMLGFGAVIYTLLQRMRAPQTVAPAAAAGIASEIPAAGAPLPPDPAATPLLALPRAGFWIRMGALLIDLVLVSVVLDLLRGWHGGYPHVVILAIYGGVMWKLRGATVGGIVCDLRVVREDGHPFDWPTAIVRALGCLLSMIVAGLGFIWIAVDPGHQAWHDKLAGTVVVRCPRGSPQP